MSWSSRLKLCTDTLDYSFSSAGVVVVPVWCWRNHRIVLHSWTQLPQPPLIYKSENHNLPASIQGWVITGMIPHSFRGTFWYHAHLTRGSWSQTVEPRPAVGTSSSSPGDRFGPTVGVPPVASQLYSPFLLSHQKSTHPTATSCKSLRMLTWCNLKMLPLYCTVRSTYIAMDIPIFVPSTFLNGPISIAILVYWNVLSGSFGIPFG